MSNEIQFPYNVSGAMIRVTVFHGSSGGWAWRPLFTSSIHLGTFSTIVSGSSFAPFALPTTSFIIPVSGIMQQGLCYFIDFPQGIPAGVYHVAAFDESLNSGPYFTTKTAIGFGEVQWAGNTSGSRYVASLSWGVTSGLFSQSVPVSIARGTMVENFPIYLKGATDRVTPLTSGTVSGQVARDGKPFTRLQSGRITELGNGFYNVQALTSGDLDGDSIRLLFTAASLSGYGSGAAPLAMTFVTQRD